MDVVLGMSNPAYMFDDFSLIEKRSFDSETCSSDRPGPGRPGRRIRGSESASDVAFSFSVVKDLTGVYKTTRVGGWGW